MIYEVELSEQADSDLRGIFEYISFELQSPENASGQLDRLEEQILSLDTMPERYRKYVNITVRQSRQSGVARATCPD